MKLILIPLLLLLASCSQYRYDFTYEKCNGQTGSYTYVNYWQFPYYSLENKRLYLWGSIWNVCDFTYTRNEIK